MLAVGPWKQIGRWEVERSLHPDCGEVFVTPANFLRTVALVLALALAALALAFSAALDSAIECR